MSLPGSAVRREPKFFLVVLSTTGGAFFAGLGGNSFKNLRQVVTQTANHLPSGGDGRAFANACRRGKRGVVQSNNPVSGRKSVWRGAKVFAQDAADQITTGSRRDDTLSYNETQPTGCVGGDDLLRNFCWRTRVRFCVNNGGGTMYRQPLSSASFAGVKHRLELGRLKKSRGPAKAITVRRQKCFHR